MNNNYMSRIYYLYFKDKKWENSFHFGYCCIMYSLFYYTVVLRVTVRDLIIVNRSGYRKQDPI